MSIKWSSSDLQKSNQALTRDNMLLRIRRERKFIYGTRNVRVIYLKQKTLWTKRNEGHQVDPLEVMKG